MINKILKKIHSITLFLLLNMKKHKKINYMISCDVSPDILKNCGFKCKFLNGVRCNGNVVLGNFVSLNGPGTRLTAKINKIIIKNYCSIASNVIIQEYFHRFDRITSYYIHHNIFNHKINSDIFSRGDIIIEDDVWIGSNVVILSGVTIGRGSIVGAGSIVTKSIPSYSIVGGNPAKVIRKRFKEETIQILETMKWWNWDIDKVVKNKEVFSYDEDKIILNKEKLLSL